MDTLITVRRALELAKHPLILVMYELHVLLLRGATSYLSRTF
ncbi:MAG: hypothetical protein QXW41_08430 [Fervidicoccaceae archaeon]